MQVKDHVSAERLERYFNYTRRALEEAKNAVDPKSKELAEEFLDMASRYYSDAGHFHEKCDVVTAFAALNYAHGWLDAGARSGLFKVSNNELFVVD